MASNFSVSYLMITSPDQGFIKCPSIMTGNFKVTLEFKLLPWYIDIALIGLFNKNDFVAVTSYDVSSFFVTAILKENFISR